ncbi:hypothetical protein FQN60_005039, partial [Etheostoma spectabile]
MASGHPTDKFSFMYQPDTHKSKNRLASAMNPVYSPVQPGTPYGNPKNMAFTGGYTATAPTYTPNLYQTGSPGYPPGYTSAGTPYKVPPTQSNGAPPPYTPTPTPYPTAMYPIRSAYPQQNLYAQGAYYTQPVYAAQPHVIHHTTVVQPNSIPSTALYPAPVPVPAPRNNGMAAMGMVAGTTMAMSAAEHGRRGDPADNAPARPDWRTPSYCANLQGPRDTWVQLRTTSLVEPTHHIWSPPSYATAQILHGLPLVTMGTQHLSARTKLKCNSHFTIIVIVSMRHSNVFTKAAFIFFSVHLPTSHYLILYGFFLFYFLFYFLIFCCVCHWNSRRTLDQSRASVAPVSVLCWCVCGPS